MTSQRPLARAGVKSRVSRAVRRTVRVPGWKTGVATLRWLRSRGQPRVLVLGYHRIADPATDRRGMAVSTSCFEQQMRVLADLAQPIRLQDLGSSLLRKERTSAGVAVRLSLTKSSSRT